MAALERTGQSINRQVRMAHCGCKAWVVHHEQHGYRVRATFCRDRFCPRCSTARSRVAAAGIARMCEGKEIRFVTLTLKHNEHTLQQQLDRLHTCFSALRRRKFWQKHVKGGVASVEIKRRAGGRWHVHIHALVEGSYIPQRHLSGEWLAVTGDSPIVDVRQIKSDDGVRYVAKYVGKPSDAETLLQDAFHDELVEALRGRRSLLTFGSMHALPDPEPDDDGQWTVVGSLDDIYERARRGSSRDRQILSVLRPGVCFAHLHTYSHDPP